MSEMRDERGSVREVAEPGCAGPGSLIRHRYLKINFRPISV